MCNYYWDAVSERGVHTRHKYSKHPDGWNFAIPDAYLFESADCYNNCKYLFGRYIACMFITFSLFFPIFCYSFTVGLLVKTFFSFGY